MTELIDRNTGLGASDAAAACASSKWKTPYQLWLEKTGQSDIDLKEKLQIQIGNALEPVILDRFVKAQKVQIFDQQRQFVDPERPWRWATVDALSSDGGLVEAKSVGFADPKDWGENETEEVPLQYWIQCMHGMSCTGLKFTWLPVVVLNRTERLYRIQRDDDYIVQMIEREHEFMQHVWNNVAPDARTLEDCGIAWPTDDGSTIVADAETEENAARLKNVKVNAKALDVQEEELKTAIAVFMREASTLIDASGHQLLTYKSQSRTTVDSKALRQDHPALAEQYNRTTSFKVMRVK